MKNFKVGEKEFSYKSEIEEITITELIKITNILEDKKIGMTQKLYYLILILGNLTDDDIIEMNIEELEKFEVEWILNIFEIINKKEVPKYIEIDDIKYGYDRGENRSIKQIIDINYWRTESDASQDEKMVNLLTIILRPIISEIDINGNYEIEKYNTIISQANFKIMEKAKAIDVYPILNFFFNG